MKGTAPEETIQNDMQLSVSVAAPTDIGTMTGTSPTAGLVTHWLSQWRAGDRSALESLVPLVYHELRQVARRQLSRESTDHTLSPTALVHETYLRLLQQYHVHVLDRDGLLESPG